MKKREVQRVDVARAMEVNLEATGKSMYATIIEAAARARAIKSSRDKNDAKYEKLHFHTYKPISQALQDIIDEHTN